MGTPFRGGHVLRVAADDHRIAAAVIQNPFVDGRAAAATAIRACGRGHTARLVWHGLRDETHGLLGRDPHRIDLAGPTGRSH